MRIAGFVLSERRGLEAVVTMFSMKGNNMTNENQRPGQQNQTPGPKPDQQQGGGQKPGQQSQAPSKDAKNPKAPHDQRSDSDT
jgi:hypothetical protein